MTGRRSYGDPCGVARGLDLVGERWALLIVRELLFGPRRFTDLRSGLPSASPNVLSQRLDDLEAAGVVQRRKLAPPAASWVYDLTDWGRGLEDVLIGLGRWGSRAPLMPAAELSVRALMLALKTTFDPAAAWLPAVPAGEAAADEAEAGPWRALVELRLGEERFSASVESGRIVLAAGGADRPDAVIEASAPTLRDLVFGGRPAGEAERAGDLLLSGDRKAALRFLGLFPRPQRLPAAAPGRARRPGRSR
jgi:DNA-binding HxlR family transcriptional regulator